MGVTQQKTGKSVPGSGNSTFDSPEVKKPSLWQNCKRFGVARGREVRGFIGSQEGAAASSGRAR